MSFGFFSWELNPNWLGTVYAVGYRVLCSIQCYDLVINFFNIFKIVQPSTLTQHQTTHGLIDLVIE